MNEKKLTDEDIVKALDICYNFKGCTNECPYFNKNGRNFCIEDKALHKDLKDLIHRLQAEVEELRKAKVIYETVDYCAEDLKKAQKENERLTDFEAKAKCEIERLSKNETENLKTVKNLQKQVDELKGKNTDLCLDKQDLMNEISEHKNVYARLNEAYVNLNKLYEQAVKDTAKEILDKAIIIDKNTGNKGFICIEALTELCKSKGVVVE